MHLFNLPDRTPTIMSDIFFMLKRAEKIVSLNNYLEVKNRYFL